MVILECLPFDVQPTTENIATELQLVFKNFKISNRIHVIVQDNAANIIKAAEIGGWSHVGCYAHILHLVVINSLSQSKFVLSLLSKVRINCYQI